MSKQDAVKPEWLVPGAEVVLYSTGGAGTPLHVKQSAVFKVAGQSFTVMDAREPRFQIQGMAARCGSGWSAYTRHVVSLDSDEADEKLAAAREQRLIFNVDSAYETWRRERSDEHLAALRDAVSKLDDSAEMSPSR